MCSLRLCGLCPTESRVHTHTDIFIEIHTHTQSYVYKNIKAHTYMHTSMHVYFTYTYIHAQICTSTHIYHILACSLYFFTLTNRYCCASDSFCVGPYDQPSLTSHAANKPTASRAHSWASSHFSTSSGIDSVCRFLLDRLLAPHPRAVSCSDMHLMLFVVFVLCLTKLLTCGVIRSYNLFTPMRKYSVLG